MGELALLVPSRGRPHNIGRLIEAMDSTCRGETRLIVGLDADDPTLSAYHAYSDQAEIVVEPDLRRQLVRWLNLLAVPRAEEYRYIGHIGDDNLPLTVGWDVRVMESLERQGTGFCYGDDLDPGRAPGALSLHAFMTANVVRTLGYMGPPQIQHMYVDPIWFAWGKATSIEFLSDVMIEHLHYTVPGKAPKDESYEASTALIPTDCTNYNNYCDDPNGMNADIVKLGGTPYSAEAMAEFNRALNIPHRWGEPVG